MMIYTIVFFIIAIAAFLFTMLGLREGMVYTPLLNRAEFDMVSVADGVLKKNGTITFLTAAVITGSRLGGSCMT